MTAAPITPAAIRALSDDQARTIAALWRTASTSPDFENLPLALDGREGDPAPTLSTTITSALAHRFLDEDLRAAVHGAALWYTVASNGAHTLTPAQRHFLAAPWRNEQVPYGTQEQIAAALDRMDPTTRAQARFGLRQALQDQDVATEAGHGISRAISRTYGAEWVQERWPNLWTNLDETTNCRSAYDYRFLNEYHPDAVVADVERKIALLLHGTPDVVVLLIQQWARRPGFDPDWALPVGTGRKYADRGRAIEAALQEDQVTQ